jgi:hypothetical protein
LTIKLRDTVPPLWGCYATALRGDSREFKQLTAVSGDCRRLPLRDNRGPKRQCGDDGGVGKRARDIINGPQSRLDRYIRQGSREKVAVDGGGRSIKDQIKFLGMLVGIYLRGRKLQNRVNCKCPNLNITIQSKSVASVRGRTAP